jgi:hypothetical protein
MHVHAFQTLLQTVTASPSSLPVAFLARWHQPHPTLRYLQERLVRHAHSVKDGMHGLTSQERSP